MYTPSRSPVLCKHYNIAIKAYCNFDELWEVWFTHAQSMYFKLYWAMNYRELTSTQPHICSSHEEWTYECACCTKPLRGHKMCWHSSCFLLQAARLPCVSGGILDKQMYCGFIFLYLLCIYIYVCFSCLIYIDDVLWLKCLMR